MGEMKVQERETNHEPRSTWQNLRRIKGCVDPCRARLLDMVKREGGPRNSGSGTPGTVMNDCSCRGTGRKKGDKCVFEVLFQMPRRIMGPLTAKGREKGRAG